MRNVTVTLEEDVARWARIRAAELDTSVSRLLGDLLREQMQRELRYDTERQRRQVQEPRALSDGVTPYPTRDQLHERA
ncbi:MAG: CopG family transcriptional regulator [Gemmatimonadetes bacterium]|nr:CopG family transcriptional regulator [Gemmatimonadota bacterium]